MKINGLSEEVSRQIVEIIVNYKKPDRIVIFGSRVQDSFTRVSDIDIAIFSQDYSTRDINLLKDRLEEKVKIPLKFDVVNFHALEKKRLKDNILNKGKVIYDARES